MAQVKEIGLEDSGKLVAEGKAVFVWVLGPVNERLVADTLGIGEEELLVLAPMEVISSKKPADLFGGRIPVFVCRAGIYKPLRPQGCGPCHA